MTPHQLKIPGLYAIADVGLIGIESIVTAIEQAIEGGVKIIQFRDKISPPELRAALAEAVVYLCQTNDVLCIINDDVELACKIKADGVHLGQTDADLTTARACLGTEAIIGISCYNDLQRAINAEQGGANYVAFGRFFPSTTKPDAIQANIELLTEAKAQLNCPIVAIGGITAENGGQLLQAGANLLAAIDSIFGHGNASHACARFHPLFSDH